MTIRKAIASDMGEIRMIAKKHMVIISLLLISISLFTSCDFESYREKLLNGDVYGMEKLNEDTETIINAIINENKESLKSVFSEVTREESEDLDASIDELFNFFEGNVESYEYDETPPLAGKRRGLKRQTQYIRGCDIYTDKFHYEMLLIYYTEDGFDSKNVGLYHLKFFKSGTECGSWQEDMCPGILILE